MTQPTAARRTNRSGLIALSLLLLLVLMADSALPAQAQENRGAMSAPTLTSDAPGTLAISWETPSPVPSDYRIDWAKSGESYKSWKDNEGHVYPEGTETAVTIEALDPGVEYKVRMRARYNKGDYEEDPWSGPWTGDTTITVAADPPAQELPRPSGLVAAFGADGSVILSWDTPTGDNAGAVTGYRILRGDAADSLNAVEDDTATTNTTWTDDTATVGRTYFYAVQALGNDDAESAASEPLEVTVLPPPVIIEPDDEPLITQEQNSATTLLTSNEGSDRSVNYDIGGLGASLASRFTTGTEAALYEIREIAVNVNTGNETAFPTLSIFSSTESPTADPPTAAPDVELHVFTAPDTFAPGLRTFTAPETGVFLQPGTSYWIVLSGGPGTWTAVERENVAGQYRGADSATGWFFHGTQTSATPGGLGVLRLVSNVLYAYPKMQIHGTPLVAPTLDDVTIVSEPLDGDTYGAGEHIEVQFEFSGNVRYARGVAQYRLGATGSDNYRGGSFVGGNGSTTLLYRYRVQADDTDADGIRLLPNPLGMTSDGNVVHADNAALNAVVEFAQVGPDTDHKVNGATETCAALMCADLTPGNFGVSLAFRYSGEGKLTNRSFRANSEDYVIRFLVLYADGGLALQLDRPPTDLLRSNTAIQFGDSSFHFSRAITQGNALVWDNSGLSWTAGTEARFSIVEEDITPPTLTSATVSANGESMDLVFSEPLGIGFAAGFLFENVWNESPVKVVAGGNEYFVSGSFEESATLTLQFLSPIPEGEPVVLTYTDPTAGDDVFVQDRAGNDVATFTTGRGGVPAVTNNSTYNDTAGPTTTTPSNVQSDGLSIVVAFDETLSIPAGQPARSEFLNTLAGALQVTKDGASVSFTIPASALTRRALDRLLLQLSRPIFKEQRVVVTYTKPTTGNVLIKDRHGNETPSFILNSAVDTDVFLNDSEVEPPPSLTSAAVDRDGNRIELVFDKAFAVPAARTARDAFWTALAGRFSVTADSSGVSVTVNTAASDGPAGRLVLTPAPRIGAGADVVVTYTDPTPGGDDNVIKDAAGTGTDTESFTTGQDGVPGVQVNVMPAATFGERFYTAPEGSSAAVAINLSAPLNRAVIIPVIVNDMCGATSDDYTGAAANVTFNAGQTRKTFSFSATADANVESPETVTLAFGTLPAMVYEGAQTTTTVVIVEQGASNTNAEEYGCIDLPGDDGQEHLTYGLVRPGVASTGHLTEGVDTSNGLTGDYWRLDTQPGHSYRLEVTFGPEAEQDINTGGAVWTAFYDPRTGRSATCCESDHNRDDGRTVIYFEHHPLYADRVMMVDVTAYDMLPSTRGSETYNGPYEINLTDVTGSERTVSNLYESDEDEYTEPIGITSRLGLSFTTGSHTDGYRLDRIATFIRPSDGQTRAGGPRISLRSDSEGSPSATALCDFDWPSSVEDWPGGRRRPVVMDAPACADQVLAAGTTYWIVMSSPGSIPGYRTNTVTDTDFDAYGSGWTIGEDTAVFEDLTWGTDDTFRLPFEIWATER